MVLLSEANARASSFDYTASVHFDPHTLPCKPNEEQSEAVAQVQYLASSGTHCIEGGRLACGRLCGGQVLGGRLGRAVTG